MNESFITKDKKYKQTSLISFLNKKENTDEFDACDQTNVAHLKALESESNIADTDSQVASSSESETDTYRTNRVLRTKLREPIIFSEPNPVETLSILDGKNQIDEDKLDLLKIKISEHNLKLFELSMLRAKEYLEKREVIDKHKSLHILKDIRVSSHVPNNKKGIHKPSDKENINSLFSVSSPIKEEDDRMSEGARSTWNRSRTVSINAVKARTRATFYRQAPRQNLVEYWVYGLERTPGFLMKLPNFRTALQAARMKHAKEIMSLAADHLEKEVRRNSDQAAAMKAGAIKLINEDNSPEEAAKIIAEASASYDITISNMGSNEYKEFERRRQTLERSPPTPGDIQDPAANVAKNITRTTPQSSNNQGTNSGGQRGRGNRGFHQRGRGRGGSRPGKQRGGRKPYSRPDN